jgi:antitoxin component YwqK of YwqJK toxin-antitoxin module
MKLDKSKVGPDVKLKNGVFKEFFKDGSLACVGKFKNGGKVGLWKYYLKNGVVRAVGKFAGGKMTRA